MTDALETRTPNAIDRHVGARVRMRRKIVGVTQEQLAGALKLTFQQVQKYEHGANRVSASKLYEIAKILQVPVSYFFDGLPDSANEDGAEAANAANRVVTDFLATPEGLELAQMFPKIAKGNVRRHILDLVRSMADGAR
ncbi:helix-turn-helix domain-containing protein [Caulobacter sp.]|uniref:helix-turn-helix domain-containing protein n=1 Tax=Caulobacter sp. TaxID=78 RepID=UPI001B08F81E|nr:helix-turn-helix domain-containing protein [Caulobacter sp.]MBO9547369.1 helix-turn-helix transcriptional regulator [Caulobacter sp.]